jgi:ABC-type multidrug transport system fused ATPase/permease subunit
VVRPYVSGFHFGSREGGKASFARFDNDWCRLDAQVAEGGKNLSHGAKQLICFARAILRKSKVLILDEATASIDNETDKKIQSLVRERFKESTILTIAHRLNTIYDSDRVLVMDSGRVIEYDAPQTLLSNERGSFRALWDQFQEAYKQVQVQRQ